jgi:hypothetical protein
VAELLTPREVETVDRTTAPVLLTTTAATVVQTVTPVITMMITVILSVIVQTAATDVTITVTFTDPVTGSQESLTPAAFNGGAVAVGAADAAVHAYVQGGSPVTVSATAGTANQVSVSVATTAHP